MEAAFFYFDNAAVLIEQEVSVAVGECFESILA